MRSAFGVDHGIVSKREPNRVPDWMGGVVPMSAANAYNRSTSHKTEAGLSNFAVKAGGSAVGGLTGLGLTALAVKTKKLPKWFLRDSTIRPIKGLTKAPTTIKAGEKQRSIATTTGGIIGGVAGGTAANLHLKAVKKNPRYNEGRVAKGLPRWVANNPKKAAALADKWSNSTHLGDGASIHSQAARKKAAGKWLESKMEGKDYGRRAEVNQSEWAVESGLDHGVTRRVLTGASYRPKYKWKNPQERPEPQWKGWQGKLNPKFAAKKKADIKRAKSQGLT